MFKFRINRTNGHRSKNMHAYEIFMISVFNLSKREFQMRNDFEHVFKRRERERERERENREGKKKKNHFTNNIIITRRVIIPRI